MKVEFNKIKSGFVVAFYRPQIEKGIEKVGDEGVKFLLEYIRKNPGKRAPHIAGMLKVPLKTLERWLKKLKAEGKIKYEGSSKTGGYYVVGQPR